MVFSVRFSLCAVLLLEAGIKAANPLPPAIREGFQISGPHGGDQLFAIGSDAAGNVYLGAAQMEAFFPLATRLPLGP